MLEHSLRDLRYAWRAVARMPLLSSVIVLSLGAGIGVNVVVFSWFQAVVLKPLPGVKDARAFHFIEPRAETGSFPGTSWQEYRDLRGRLRTMPDALAFRMVPLNVGQTAQTERIYGLLVSDNYFTALGLEPALGRFFRPEEAAAGAAQPVAVISYGMWQSRFGGAADAVGKILRTNDRDLHVVGVAPRAFQGTVLGLDFAIWVPAPLAPLLFQGSRELEDRSVRGYAVMGKLAGGVTQAIAQDEVGAAMRELAAAFPASNSTIAAEVRPFWKAPRGPQQMIAYALVALQGIMLLVLLAVCGNTANLMLARASTRQREIAVRLALGAGRWRIASVLLSESLVLAALGCLLGVGLAVWGTDAIRAVPFIGTFPIRFQTSVDAAGLGVAIALAAVGGLIFGLAPAVHVPRVDVQQTLRTAARGASRSRMRNALMGVEVALALTVLLIAGLFFRNLTQARGVDPGFRREGVLLASYNLTGRDVDNDRAREFAARLLDRLRALPGVEAAAIASFVPLDIHGLPLRSLTIEGRARPDGMADQALGNNVTPGYFAVMGIPFVRGADFAGLRDSSRPAEAVVNAEFVRRFLPDVEPIGRRITYRDRAFVIAGVVRDTRYESFDEPPTPIVYWSYRDRPSVAGEMHIRTEAGRESAIAAAVRQAVRDIDPALPIYDVRTMAEHVEKNLFLRRVPARMFAVLGPMLLALAAIGIYAVVAYGVAQRTTEIGIRIALGATGPRVVRQILRETLRVVVMGAALGWLPVYVVQIHIAPGRPLDLGVFAGVPLLLLGVAAAACWVPARRAAAVDPMTALRQE